MNCTKAQRLLDDLAAQRLRRRLAREVQQHLANCTDCRVASQRLAKLQRLLALKRYEQPGAAYFNGVCAEFHRRLAQEWQRGSAWQRAWQALRQHLISQPDSWGRFAAATAVGAAAVALLLWVSEQPGEVAVLQAESPTSTMLAAQQPPAVGTHWAEPQVAVRVAPPPLPITPVTDLAGSTLNELPPRYVLDRVRVTPVNYEPAAVHF